MSFGGIGGGRLAGEGIRKRSKISRVKGDFIGEERRASQDILEFAHVAPGQLWRASIMSTSGVACFGGSERSSAIRVSQAAAKLAEIFEPFAKRRDGYHDASKAIVEVFTEGALSHHRFEVAVRRRDDAYVNFDWRCAAHSVRTRALEEPATERPASSARCRRFRRGRACPRRPFRIGPSYGCSRP